jgi:hypothetical protein
VEELVRGVSGGSKSERGKERKRGIRQEEVSGHRRVEGEWKGSSRSGRSGMSKKMEKRAFAFPQQHARHKTKTKKGTIIKRQNEKPPTRNNVKLANKTAPSNCFDVLV